MKSSTLLKLLTLYLALFTLPLISPQFTGAHERHPMALQELNWQAENIQRVYALAEDFQAGALIKIWNMPGQVEDVDGRRCLVGLVEKYRNRIEALLDAVPEAHDDLERWETAHLMEPAWTAQLPALRQHADKVLERYDEILQRLE